ncbi:hypothetical protein [Arthrobacter sp. D1-17]
MEEQEIAGVARHLYALPFDEFVAARTAAAKAAAAESNRPLSLAIKALPKPSAAAWTVNMLAYHRPDTVRQLRDLGQTMQGAQAALDAAALRELARERRKLLTDAVGAARLAAKQQGRPVSAPVAAEVEETLRAATADPAAAAAVQSGMLLRVLNADGVDRVDLEGAVAVPSALGQVAEPPKPATRKAAGPKPPVKIRPESQPQSKRRPAAGPEKPRLQAVDRTPRPPSPSLLEKAEAALAEAEAAASAAAAEAEAREEALNKAAEEFARLTADVSETRQRLRALEASLEALRKERETAEAEAKQSVRAAEKSRRTAMLAKERVLRLRNTPD